MTLWTVARQAPVSMAFSRQGYWSGLLFPPPGDLPEAGIEPSSLMSPALAGGFCGNPLSRALAFVTDDYRCEDSANRVSPGYICT